MAESGLSSLVGSVSVMHLSLTYVNQATLIDMPVMQWEWCVKQMGNVLLQGPPHHTLLNA